MKRYVSLDFLRGIAIFGMVFVHILVNIYDLSWTESDASLTGAPLVAIIMLVSGLYLGSWAGLFLMVSATGNMISMQSNLKAGNGVKSMLMKQVVGGLILVFFSFLCEGTFQYYGLFHNLIDGSTDLTKPFWKAYTMETIATIGWSMVLNGIVHALLSRNDGYLKIRRNIVIYAILAIVSVALTQLVWDWVRSMYLTYSLDPLNPRGIFRPSINAPFSEYLWKFFLLPLGGQPEPLFPFFAVSCIGSIIGLKLVEEPVTRTWPKRGVIIGMLIVVFGLLFWIIGDLPFDSLLPLEDFSTFTRIGDGLNWRWLPWICFITGGQIVLVCLTFRLIEFRGKAQKFAAKTHFFRRFGMIAFTNYAFHRIIAIVPLYLFSLLIQVPISLEVKSLNGWLTLVCVAIVVLVIHGLMLLWEKVDYIGSLEWMIGTISAYLLGVPKKSPQKMPWYRWGARNQKEIFYDVEWINIFPETDNGGVEFRNSKLALKFAALGFLLFPATILGLTLAKSSLQLEGTNKYAQKAKKIGLIAGIINIVLIIVLYFLRLTTFGIKSL